jgi:FixJ family two-component response regulator
MVYIIDDDRNVLRGFQILLKSEGIESEIFSKVEEFLETWEHNNNDIFILDMHMPGINGCEFLAYLKNRNLHPDVIIVTAFDEMESREWSQNYGALAFLTKPVDSDLLIDAIKNKSRYLIKY